MRRPAQLGQRPRTLHEKATAMSSPHVVHCTWTKPSAKSPHVRYFWMVGETGWQLSHGEKSRLYIARALLQGAELLVLDESFGALDPETLHEAMACVLARAPTMVVIAHP